ncbi:hypothetical protein [Methylobacterium pseudosasicola]|uniref:hypothetical protein n=1 Tax=Methylobacterium pseudosasicola TaxID=582667 RepID=UPI0011142546|nr:hypothetical protein [Methylobacterium pseudosasicola]
MLVPLAVAGCDKLVGLTGLGVAADEAGALPVSACGLGLTVGERVGPASAGCAVLVVPLGALAVGLVGTVAAAGWTGLAGALVGLMLAAGVVGIPVALVAAPFVPVGAGLVGLGAEAGTALAGAVVMAEVPLEDAEPVGVGAAVPDEPGVMAAEPAAFDPAAGVFAMPFAGVGAATVFVEPVDE